MAQQLVLDAKPVADPAGDKVDGVFPGARPDRKSILPKQPVAGDYFNRVDDASSATPCTCRR
jgi:hypothetical protein